MKRLIFITVLLILYVPHSFGESANKKALDLRNRGVEYMLQQRYSEALDHFTDAMELYEPNTSGYYGCLGNIASVYAYMGNLDRCLYYQKRVYDEAVRNNNTDIQSEMAINLVGTYCAMANLPKAREYFSYQVKNPLKDVVLSRHYFLYNQALIANLEKKYDIANYYHKEAIRHARNRLPSNYIISQYLGISKNQLLSDNPDSAIYYTNIAIDLAQKDSNILKMHESMSVMEEIYRSIGETNKADSFSILKKAYADSIFKRTQFEKSQNKLFHHEAKINEGKLGNMSKRIDTQQKMLIIALLIILVSIGIFLIIYLNVQKMYSSQKLLLERNEELISSENKLRKILKDHYDKNSLPATDTSDNDKKDNLSGRSLQLDQSQVRELANKINQVMQDISIISRQDFSLTMLAEEVESNSRYVSYVINEIFGKNFRTLLNEQRIREACRRLSDNKRYGNVTIQSIYKDLGYSSPGSFIDAFKRITGLTPSKYQKKNSNPL